MALTKVGWQGLILVLAMWGGLLGAAPPVLDAVYPSGGKSGTEFGAVVSGRMDPWPCEIWCSHAGVKFSPDPEKAGSFLVNVGDEVEPGAYLIRLVNKEGGSIPRTFVVGEVDEITEDEKLDHGSLTKPFKLTGPLPLVVNGRLGKSNEVDFYGVSLKHGQRISIRLEGYSLQSPIDPHLHLYDSSGTRLAIGNDRPGGLDPELEFEVPADGDYHVAVMAFAHPPSASVSFTGNAKSVYRLYLGESGEAVDVGGEKPTENLSLPIKKRRGVLDGKDGARFVFDAKKSQKLLMQVEGKVLGSPVDGVLRIEAGDGKLIKEIDDTKTSSDPEYLWTVPADGKYVVVVSDRFGRSGKDLFFQLSVEEPVPAFRASIAKSEFLVSPEKPVEIELTVERLHGHSTELAVEVPELPDGVDVELPKIPGKGGKVNLKVSVNKGAKPASVPLRIHVFEFGEEDEGVRKAAIFSFQTKTSQGGYLIDVTGDHWLTVTE